MSLKLNSRALRTVLLSALIFGLVGVAQGTVITLNPQSSYLRHDAADTPAVNPLFIDLSLYGSSIRIQPLGDMCFGSAPCSELPPQVGALFTTSNSLGLYTDLNRLSGVLASGQPGFATQNTFLGASTDIANDFLVPNGGGWLNLNVPVGAHWLVVGVVDSNYRDNSDPNQNLQFAIETVNASAPEPGTLLLFGVGLGVLVAAKRLKKVRG